MSTITKKELVEQVAQHTGADRGETRKIVQAFLDAVVQELNRGNRLEFRDFGVFEVRQRAPRMAQNPKTMEKVKVPAKRSVRFKPGRLMREQSVAPQELVTAR
ncbi:MAG: integration host factor subunit beta [Planctomycetota bacterium]|jgi:integration host factor subunit beta|nr:MAG: integration host factor subunit beta [Planctomycetota bacterium]